MVTKKELLTGVILFVKNEVIPNISDKALKMVMSAALYAIDAKPDIIDPFVNNAVVSAILQGNDGSYDVDTTINILKKLAADYGGIPITIPPIKFITSSETILTFHESDLTCLKGYIMNSSNKEED